MRASVTRVRRDRMPLQASATSSGIEGSTITLPCRNTGTWTSSSSAVANWDASNCRGNVTFCRSRLGMGIIRIRNDQGNRTARKKIQPRKKKNKHPSQIRGEKHQKKKKQTPQEKKESPPPKKNFPPQRPPNPRGGPFFFFLGDGFFFRAVLF